jgi:hypothetical protein
MEHETDEGPELALSDPATRETVAVMLEADCTAQQIRAWLAQGNAQALASFDAEWEQFVQAFKDRSDAS